MARKRKALTPRQAEFRTLAKRANQRLVRLEREIAATGAPEGARGNAYTLAEYYLGQLGRRRWSESPTALSEDEFNEQFAQINQFLAEESSTVSGFRALHASRRQYEEWVKTRKKYNVDESVEHSQQDWNFYEAMRTLRFLGIDKMFDYREIMAAVAEAGDVSQDMINEAILELARQKKLGLMNMRKKFEKMGKMV